MTSILSPTPKMQFVKVVDGKLVPLAFGKLQTYAAGTSTPLATYTDSTGGTPNPNPLTLDANGQANVWLGSSAYKFDLFDADGVTRISGWPIDNIDPAAYSNDALLAQAIGCFAGELPPSNPVRGQLWYQPSVKTLWQYNGSTWDALLGASNAVSQTYTAAITSGTAPNYTLTPSIALTSLGTGGIRYRVKFHADGTTGSNTLNISGLGAKNLLQYDQRGIKSAGVTKAGLLADVEWDGTDFVILDGVPDGGQVRGVIRGLIASSTGTDANYSIACEEASLYDGATAHRVSRFGLSLTLNTAGAGANGLDTGTLAGTTLYYVWLIYNSTTNTDAALLSLSVATPTLPAGYTYAALIGCLRTDGTANKYPLAQYQRGRHIQYRAGVGNVSALPVIGSGAGTNVACAVGGHMPVGKTLSGRFIMATSGATAYLSANNTTPASDCAASTNITSNNWSWEAVLVLESSNVYYTGGAATAVKVLGYEMDL